MTRARNFGVFCCGICVGLVSLQAQSFLAGLAHWPYPVWAVMFWTLMPLPFFLFLIWLVWPVATFPGGKLFAPLVFLIGLFALRSLDLRALSRPVQVVMALLVWICVTAFWSPAVPTLFEGSIFEGNFSVEAAHLRFVFTCIGCLLFVRLMLAAPPARVVPAWKWVCAGISAQVLIVGYVAFNYEAFVATPGEPMVPSAQSMGRNMNLLVMALPILIGLSALTLKPKQALGAGLLLGALTFWFAILIDGLAIVLALCIAALCYGVFRIQAKNGFRIICNLIALSIGAMPFAAWGLGALTPNGAGFIPLSSAQRLSIWQATVEKIAEKPVFGHGVNATSTWTETYASRPDLLARLSPELIDKRIILYHPHNMSLQLWVETGLVGVGLVMAALVLLGRALPEPANLHRSVQIGIAGVLGAALAYFTVSYSLWDESFWASIAVVFSGLVVLMRKAQA